MSELAISVTCGRFLKIYFNETLHLSIKKKSITGIQSWVADGYYCIEYTLAGGETILTEYNTAEKWSQILKQLDQLYM